MWNLVESELFRMEPGALLEEPQAFQAVGEKTYTHTHIYIYISQVQRLQEGLTKARLQTLNLAVSNESEKSKHPNESVSCFGA